MSYNLNPNNVFLELLLYLLSDLRFKRHLNHAIKALRSLSIMQFIVDRHFLCNYSKNRDTIIYFLPYFMLLSRCIKNGEGYFYKALFIKKIRHEIYKNEICKCEWNNKNLRNDKKKKCNFPFNYNLNILLRVLGN